MFTRLVNRYLKLLHDRPMATQVVSSAVICGGGDVICQFVVNRKSLKDYDVKRTIPFVLVGGFYIAPVLIKWFKLLERIKFGGPRFRPISMVLVDQICMSPVIQTTYQFGVRVVGGQDMKEAVRNVKKNWLEIYLNGLKLWPATQLINFYFVPLKYRVLLVQSVGLFWNVYMAWEATRVMEE